MIDLHVHSTASDGTFTPAQLVSMAKENGVCAFALTDHDSTDGIEEALDAASLNHIEVIPGVELSTEYNGKEIHVVGLYIDWKNPSLAKQLAEFRECRDNRNLKMAERLSQEGFSISPDALYQMFPNCVLTRAHIARYLTKTGQVQSIAEVFDKYIGEGCKCYIDRPKVTPTEAVKLIHQANGTAILAHPCLYKMDRSELLVMIEEMKTESLDGIEAIYSCNRENDETDFRNLADRYHLLVSGGSDFHGSNKPDILLGTGKGNLNIPYEILNAIKNSRGMTVQGKTY